MIDEQIKSLVERYIEAATNQESCSKELSKAQQALERVSTQKLRIAEELLKHVGNNVQERHVLTGAGLVRIHYKDGVRWIAVEKM